MNMKSNHPIIHIGFPKTGTTWFQKQLYPKIEDAYFFSREELVMYLINIDVFTFCPEKARAQLEKLADNKRIIICEELLVGGLDIPYGLGEFIKLMADRIYAVFPDGEIVIFTRNQEEILASAYFQHIRSGGTFSVAKYINSAKTFNTFFKNHLLYSLDFFRFDITIGYYEKLFTKNCVSVYLYEDFDSETESFLNSYLKDFNLNAIGTIEYKTIENQRFSKPLIISMRFFNHFYMKNTIRKNYWINIPILYPLFLQIHLRINRWKVFSNWRSNSSILGKKRIQVIRTFYKSSNHNLGAVVDIHKLEKYSYPL